MKKLTIKPSGPLKGTITVPGDKSISHRSIIFGSIAEGVTRVKGLLEGEDVLCTIGAFRALGVSIRKEKPGRWRIEGKGLKGLKAPSKVIDCGNSGTSLRLLTGLFSGLPFTATMTGDASLNSRPMGRVTEPLKEMGAVIEEIRNKKGRWIRVRGHPLCGGKFSLKVASAQLKSALLLAGLSGSAPVTVTEPVRSRDHSERMLKSFGAQIQVKDRRVTLTPGRRLKGQKIIIPSDFSSAAFFLVAGLINPNPQTILVIKNVGMNPTRTGLLQILKRMGGHIDILRPRTICGEPVADLRVRPSQLKGTSVTSKGPPNLPSLIDEVPILCVAAAMAKGKTIIRGAEELRIKETDRIRAMATELRKFGVPLQELPDGLVIEGGRPLKGARGKSYGDHRVAMSLAVLGAVVRGATQIDDTECISTSFPNFVSLFKKIGAGFSKENPLTIQRFPY